MKINDLKWVSGFWSTPDGKKIPYERAYMTDSFECLQPDPWGYMDAPLFEIQITRWPRKVKIVMIANEGCDGYTNDGDGDGIIFDVVSRTIFPLIEVDRYTFQHDFEKIIKSIEPMIEKARCKIDHKYDY